MKQARPRLEDVLVASGYITQEQLMQALYTQKNTGGRLGSILIQLGYISEADWLQALEAQLGIAYVDLANTFIEQAVAESIPLALAERYQVVPVSRTGSALILAMADPADVLAIDDVQMVSGCQVRPVLAGEKQIMRAIQQAYGVRDLVKQAVTRLRTDEAEPVQSVEDAPVIAIVNALFRQAIREHASDIHWEPQEGNLRVRLRIDGVLRDVCSFTMDIHPAVISCIKLMGGMDIAEKRVPQDGRTKFCENGRDIDCRIATLPTILGEKVAIRILDRQSLQLGIRQLGLSEWNFNQYSRLYAQTYGMILVTGPTGSGKTTTLYSTLSEISTPDKQVITVEEPVEYRLPGINQVQVNAKTGVLFANTLRAILRQDPNIIMIGEIRDSETADIAIRAALTGHLVFSTMHTNDAPGAITRFMDMGIEPFLVSSVMLGAMAQRLIRVICPQCKAAYVPPEDSLERVFLGVDRRTDLTLFRGDGCEHCSYSGYQGRIAIHEVLSMTAGIRKLVNRRAADDEIREQALREGMLGLKDDVVDKVLQGITTVAEAMRITGDFDSRRFSCVQAEGGGGDVG